MHSLVATNLYVESVKGYGWDLMLGRLFRGVYDGTGTASTTTYGLGSGCSETIRTGTIDYGIQRLAQGSFIENPNRWWYY